MRAPNVLIVDDDTSIREVLRDALTDEGFGVSEARNGREALSRLAANEIPDVMVLDLMMPEMNGWQVLKHLREEPGPRVPVLIVSASRPDPELLTALDEDLRDFVAKPFELEELVMRMQSLMRRAPARQPKPSGLLRVYALGSLRVLRDDILLFDESWRNKPAKTIFKLLLTNAGRRFSKDTLTEEIWPETDPDAAANRLRVAVFELRKMLGGRRKEDTGPSYIGQQEGGYYFDAALPYWSDVRAFEAAVERGARHVAASERDAALEAYAEAESLYAGDYLRDDPYLEWTVPMRERLRERYLAMMADAAEIRSLQGDPAAAAGYCRKILRIEPWREEVYRHLMEYLSEAGRPLEALRAFEECRRALHAEVEAQPSAQTVAVRDRIAAEMNRSEPEAQSG